MQLEFERFLFLIFPYVLCTTLAAFIIWGEDVKKHVPRLVIYSLLAGSAQLLTDYIRELEVIRFIIEVAVGYTLVLLVFGKSWLWTFKIFATSYLIGYLTTGLSIAVYLLVLDRPFSEMYNHVEYWLTLFLPINILGTLLAYLLHRLWMGRHSLLGELNKASASPSIFIALFVQTVLFVGLSGQIGLYYLGRSRNEALLLLAGLFVLFFLSIYILVKYIYISRGELAATQDSVSENIMEMINTVRGQRHDFINHLQVIHGLNQISDKEALDDYLSDLLSEVTRYNEMLKIDNPVIAALINAKIAQAGSRGISLRVQVKSSLAHIANAAFAMGRIMGNLIDNALEAVEEAGENWVEVSIEEQNSLIICSVTNPSKGSSKSLKKAFAPGVSSKSEHDGLGLYVCQKLCSQLQGRLDWTIDENNRITFTLTVPQARN